MSALRCLFLVSVCLLAGLQNAWAQYAWVREYFDFEKKALKVEYQVLQSEPKKLNGLYISYYPDGTVQSKGHYLNGQQHGKWTYYFQNGNRKSSGYYSGGQKSGAWDYYYESGKSSQAGRMHANKKTGIWKYYYESGGIKSEGEFIEDKNQGLWNYYQEDGTLKATATFNKGKGNYEERYLNGNLKMQGQIRDGGSDSIWVYYYENGNKKAEGHEKNGLKMGRWRFYHPDNTLMSEGEFLADQEYGEWIYYYPNGQISSKGVMEQGRKQGAWNLFYESGKFMGEATFDKGYGPYREFYDNGKVKMTGYISGNTYIGEWKYYYDDGQLEGECVYINGEGDYMGYYPDGSKKISGRLKNGQKTGVWRLYDPDGNLSGLYKSYFEPGQEEPSADTTRPVAQVVPVLKKRGKPRLILPGKQIHFFIPKINELRGFIIGANPVAPLFNQLPVSLEYYFDKRLGYEAGATLLRRPFFDNHTSYLAQIFETPVTQGASAYIRQKLYFSKRGPGTFYFAQEFRYTYLEHSESYRMGITDTTAVTVVRTAEEHKAEFSLLLGRRFFTEVGHSSITFDVWAGMGVGYRWFDRNAEAQAHFISLPKKPLTLPARLGIMIGYLF